jgi:hypothetical protein
MFKMWLSLAPAAYDEIKDSESTMIRELQNKYEKDLNSIREEMENKFRQILTKIDVSTLK